MILVGTKLFSHVPDIVFPEGGAKYKMIPEKSRYKCLNCADRE